MQRPTLTFCAAPAAAGRRAALACAAQHAFQAREQLAQVEGLGQVVVGADFQPDHAVHHLARAGHHDDGDVVVGCAASA